MKKEQEILTQKCLAQSMAFETFIRRSKKGSIAKYAKYNHYYLNYLNAENGEHIFKYLGNHAKQKAHLRKMLNEAIHIFLSSKFSNDMLDLKVKLRTAETAEQFYCIVDKGLELTQNLTKR